MYIQLMKQKFYEKSIQKVFLFIHSEWKSEIFLLIACFSISSLQSEETNLGLTLVINNEVCYMWIIILITMYYTM